MDITDQYPSTFDMPRIAGGQDAVLAVLVGARKRYKRGATPHAYIAAGSEVCAIGAVAREAGVTLRQFEDDPDSDLSNWRKFRKTLERASIEKPLIDATREAIRLLNKAAGKLYPESKQSGSWSGPLEWINQVYEDPDDIDAWRKNAKKAVLACYDKAIEDRQAALAA